MNIIRKKLEKKEKLSGAVVCLTDPCICEMYGYAGMDCAWIDLEHTYTSYKEIFCHINSAKSAGVGSMVRVPQDDLTATKKVLEMGPDAILFPMVRSYEQAKALIDMTVYPPYGERGFGPIRAIGYGAIDAKEYSTEKTFDMYRFIQIEHIDCVEEIEKIVEIPYLDGFIFGPCDLSFSLGEPLNVKGEKTAEQIKKAIEIIRKHGKITGLAGGMDEETVKFWSDFDFDMLFSGGDWNFLYESSRKTADLMKKYFK